MELDLHVDSKSAIILKLSMHHGFLKVLKPTVLQSSHPYIQRVQSTFICKMTKHITKQKTLVNKVPNITNDRNGLGKGKLKRKRQN